MSAPELEIKLELKRLEVEELNKEWLTKYRAITEYGRKQQNNVCLNIRGTARENELLRDWWDRVDETFICKDEEGLYVQYYKDSLQQYTKKEFYPYDKDKSYQDDIYEIMNLLEHVIIQHSINLDTPISYQSKELNNTGALVILLQNLQDMR